ncbi:hypothetical protein SLE2022_073280 [Rubroshorea leprosula]
MICVRAIPFSSSSPSQFLLVANRSDPRIPFSTRRRRRGIRRRNGDLPLKKNIKFETLSDDDQNIRLVLDLEQISSLPSSKFRQLLNYSRDAYDDLRNFVTVDSYTRTLRVSCRKSTLQFLGGVFLCGFVVVFAFRVLLNLVMGFKARLRSRENVIVRRDRSLGGREVIVGIKGDNQQFKPLKARASPVQALGRGKMDYPIGVQVQEKLPKWWPESVANGGTVFNREYYQREANRLTRAITDNRTSGKDISEEDIIQLRQICRTSGVRTSFDTTNTRDSFYRASIELVLNVCSWAPSHSTSVEVDGEDAQEFIAGLAENVGLEEIRAARMVCAAVAARTRLRFLQAWALKMQGKHSEAVSELSKICVIHRIFPPEESSPEMEMVARGLEKVLKVEQRELLMGMLVGACGEENRKSAAEALGLVW